MRRQHGLSLNRGLELALCQRVVLILLRQAPFKLMSLCRSILFERLGYTLCLLLTSAHNPRGSGVEVPQVRKRIDIFAIELDRPLKFIPHLLRQSVCLYGVNAVGLFAIGPPEPEVISTIHRHKLDRGFALVDGIIPALLLVVHAAKQIVRLCVGRVCGQ